MLQCQGITYFENRDPRLELQKPLCLRIRIESLPKELKFFIMFIALNTPLQKRLKNYAMKTDRNKDWCFNNSLLKGICSGLFLRLPMHAKPVYLACC